jgi:hypothetical protein
MERHVGAPVGVENIRTLAAQDTANIMLPVTAEF